MYEIQKNLNRLDNMQPTYFLDPSEQNELKIKLGKTKYNVFLPNKDSEKVINLIKEYVDMQERYVEEIKEFL